MLLISVSFLSLLWCDRKFVELFSVRLHQANKLNYVKSAASKRFASRCFRSCSRALLLSCSLAHLLACSLTRLLSYSLARFAWNSHFAS